MQRAEREVTGLGDGQRGLDRLHVAHLADQHDVGVLAQDVLERALERLRVAADLALVDEAVLVAVLELDRIFDGDDVAVFVVLIRSIIDASVVDLPEPVGPVTSTSPRGRSHSSVTIGGMPRFSSGMMLYGTSRNAPATQLCCM